MNPPAPFQVLDERQEDGVAVFSVQLPEDRPFVEGHFPGYPVVPAIGQLAILSSLLSRVIDSAGPLFGVDHLRLTRPVFPGDLLEIRLETLRGGARVPFDVRRDGASVSCGTLCIRTEAE